MCISWLYSILNIEEFLIFTRDFHGDFRGDLRGDSQGLAFHHWQDCGLESSQNEFFIINALG